MKKKNVSTIKEVREQLQLANSHISYALGHWNRYSHGPGDGPSSSKFEAAINILKDITNNNKYESYCIYREDIEDYIEELNELGLIRGNYTIKELIATGIMKNIEDELQYIKEVLENV